MQSALTVDLEEWFTVSNLSHLYSFESWSQQELRLEKNTDTLLALFARYKVRATFFVLGWVAERYPELIRRIAIQGHEIASHGYQHRLVNTMEPKEFEEDLLRSIEAIKGAVDTEILGFRAPSFSVDMDKSWIFDVLKSTGFSYDSSLFPIPFHPDYGSNKVPLFPFTHSNGLIEFPMTCVRVAGINLPCSGGGYFRLLPYGWFHFGFSQRGRENLPAVFYLHPWEIDAGQPRVKNLSMMKSFRHYTNLHKTEARLGKLLEDFPFTTMRQVLGL